MKTPKQGPQGRQQFSWHEFATPRSQPHKTGGRKLQEGNSLCYGRFPKYGNLIIGTPGIPSLGNFSISYRKHPYFDNWELC